ncbi:hypothetical protein D3C71_471480 [compost metagenome]
MQENLLIIVLSLWTLAFLIATFRIFWEEYGPVPRNIIRGVYYLWLDSTLSKIVRIWLVLTVLHLILAVVLIFTIIAKLV